LLQLAQRLIECEEWCRDYDEMRPIFPLDAGAADQREIRLADESPSLEGMAGAFPLDVERRDSAQFVMNSTQKLGFRITISLSDRG
jgi:hypothetical protein